MTIRTFHPNKLAVGVALSLSLIAWTVEKSLAEETPLRVAVVDAGDNPSAPPVLLDLIVVQLSQQQGLVLLERQQIDAVLQEQERNLELAKIEAPETFVAAGRILGADALVLISANPPNEQGLQPIEVRIVETRRGVRFGEIVLVWSEDEQAVAEQIESATTFIASRLGRVQTSEGKFTVVSLAGFRTDELSQEAHRFKRNIEAWLEAWLASQPGIAVAERTKVLPLIDERKLASDLPAALGNADAAIDGTFKLDFSEQQPRVELKLRVIRKNGSVASHTLCAPLSDLTSLRESAGKTILGLLAVEKIKPNFDATSEAQLLSDEAERLLQIGRRYEALQRLTIAFALEPDSFQIQALLLQAGVQFAPDSEPIHLASGAMFYPTALFIADIAHRVVDKLDQRVPAPNDLHLYDPESLLSRAVDLGIGMEYRRHGKDDEISPEEAVQNEWYRASISDLYRRCLMVSKAIGDRCYSRTLLQGISFSMHWEETPESALELRRELLQRAAVVLQTDSDHDSILTNSNEFDLGSNKAWSNRIDLPDLYKSYASALADSDRPFLQARGERALAIHVFRMSEDKKLAMKHYRRFVDLIVEDLIPNYPNLAHDLGGYWLEIDHGREPRWLTDAEAGEMWSRVIRAAWASKCPRSTQPWESRIKATVIHLEEAGQVEQAQTLLQDCLDKLRNAPEGLTRQQVSRQWEQSSARLNVLLVELKARNPSQLPQNIETPKLAVECQPCLTLRQLEPELLRAIQLPKDIFKNQPEQRKQQQFDFLLPHLCKLAGIKATEDGFAVLCVVEEFPHGKAVNHNRHIHRLVVARLDQRGKYASSVLCSASIEPVDQEFAELRDNVLWPLATAVGNTFIAPPNHGILWIPRSGEPVHFSSQYLDQSSLTQRPAPFDTVWQLIPSGGKLYAGCGDPLTPTIYVIDYQQGVTTELLDTRALPEKHPMRSRKGFLMMAGPPGKLLFWAKSSRNPHSTDPRLGGDLFVMNLKDQSLRPAEIPIFLEWQFSLALKRLPYHDFPQSLGIGTPDGTLGIFNPEKQRVDWLVMAKNGTKPDTPSLVVGHAGMAVNQRYLLASQKKVGESVTNDWHKYYNFVVRVQADANFDWLLYNRDHPQPTKLVSPNLPPPGKVKQFLLDDRNHAFMMTSKEVFRIELPKLEDH